MRMQVEPVAEAVVMEVEDQVTATGTPPLVDKDLVAQLVGDAQRLGLSVEGEGGLLAQLTKLVLESALEGEMTAHLGYDKHERVEGSDNARMEDRTSRTHGGKNENSGGLWHELKAPMFGVA